MEKVALVLLAVLALAQAVPVDKYIVSGDNAFTCEFPHMVFIDIKLKHRDSYCGATLISNKHVLTAAHCIDGEVKSITAHFGSTTKADTDTTIPVRQWVKHRDYTIGDEILNDVALLQLRTPVQFSRCIQPIDLPQKGEVFTGSCVAAGWGKTGNNGIYPTKLQRTGITIIPTTECKKTSYGIDAKQHICVGDQKQNGRNICNGDSGGGLVCKRANGTPVVAGVASYVFDCNEGFGVFANTENFLEFIKVHMDVWQ